MKRDYWVRCAKIFGFLAGIGILMLLYEFSQRDTVQSSVIGQVIFITVIALTVLASYSFTTKKPEAIFFGYLIGIIEFIRAVFSYNYSEVFSLITTGSIKPFMFSFGLIALNYLIVILIISYVRLAQKQSTHLNQLQPTNRLLQVRVPSIFSVCSWILVFITLSAPYYLAQDPSSQLVLIFSVPLMILSICILFLFSKGYKKYNKKVFGTLMIITLIAWTLLLAIFYASLIIPNQSQPEVFQDTTEDETGFLNIPKVIPKAPSPMTEEYIIESMKKLVAAGKLYISSSTDEQSFNLVCKNLYSNETMMSLLDAKIATQCGNQKRSFTMQMSDKKLGKYCADSTGTITKSSTDDNLADYDSNYNLVCSNGSRVE